MRAARIFYFIYILYIYNIQMRNPFLNVVAFSFSAISHMSTYISIYT